jgi:hypothetical protein
LRRFLFRSNCGGPFVPIRSGPVGARERRRGLRDRPYMAREGQTMAAKTTSADGDHLKALDQLRPAFERLRTERIRAEGEIERLSRELEAAEAEARAAFGTTDEAAIRRSVDAARAENAALVEDFAERLRRIGRRLADLGRSA